MGSRYSVLRGIALVAKILGYLAIVIGAVLLVACLAGMKDEALAAGGLMPAAYLIMAGLMNVAFGEVIMVFIDIEDNTRGTRDLLEEILERLPSAQPPSLASGTPGRSEADEHTQGMLDLLMRKPSDLPGPSSR